MGGVTTYQICDGMAQNQGLNELRRYYREWEVIGRYGSVVFFLYILGKYTRYTIGITVFCAVAGPWVIISAMIGYLGIYPVGIVIALVQGFYHVASRSGHWFCLGVTMVVTMLSWSIYHENFTDTRILWLVALGTGFVSGAVTEVARPVLLMFYTNTAVGRLITNEESGSGYKDFMISKVGCLWFRDSSLARIFRAICFSTQVAQPVRFS